MNMHPHFRLCALLAWCCTASLHAANLSDRAQNVDGTAKDASPKVFITVKGQDTLPGCEREYLVDVAYPAGAGPTTPGTYKQAVRYFPGNNRVDIHTATSHEQRDVKLIVDPPALKVTLEWAGNDHDYDLYVNAVNWTNKVIPEGKLDRDAYAGQDTGPGVENITFPKAAEGVYDVYVNYYSNHGHTGEFDPTTVTIKLGDKTLYTETLTLRTAEAHGGSLAGDGKSVWNVATVVVHGTKPGGYRVVDKDWKEVPLGLRDIFMGADDKPIVREGGSLGVFPRTSFQVTDLSGPNGANRVVMAKGQSAQLVAKGTVNSGSANQQQRAVLGVFHSSDAGVAVVDDLGVVTGVQGGKATITTDQGAGSIDVYVIDTRIVADTDRDGAIDPDKDRPLKEVWSKDRGMIYNVNFNDSAGTAHKPDAVSFKDDGTPTDENLVIETGDVPDITPVLIAKTGVALPAGAAMFLKVPAAEQIKAFHFFPERSEGKSAIWGGLTAVAASTATEIDVTAKLGTTTDTNAGIEGLLFHNEGTINPFKGFVEITMELRDGGRVIKADTIKCKVAPWMILANNQASEEIWTIDAVGNATTRLQASADAGYFGLDDSGQLNTATLPDAGSRWFQDHLEFGYTQRPGGPKVRMVFRLPYDRPGSPPQPKWPVTKLLKADTGIFQIGVNLGADSGDYGGNVEALPPDNKHKLGRIIVGDTSSTELQKFMTSQEVQEPVVDVPVKWLAVGHVDEVVCFLGGNKIAIADPTTAWNLLTAIPAADQSSAVFFAKGPKAEGGEVGIAVNHRPGGMKTRVYDGPAIGTITTIPDSMIADGETLTIADRAGHQVVFEFDKNGMVAAGHLAVAIPPLAAGAVRSADEMRDLLIAAINASGLTVNAIANGAATIHLWNSVKGVAGNQAISETVANAGFVVDGMANGKAGGRDFSTSVGWKYLRTYTFTAAVPPVPTGGATAELSSLKDGYVEIAKIWENGSKMVDGAAGARDHSWWAENTLATTDAYATEPKAKDRYVFCKDIFFWNRGSPAVVTVAEVLADPDFRALNLTDIQGVISGPAGSIQKKLSDAGDPAPTFVKVPCLFFGSRTGGGALGDGTGFATGRHAAAFHPGPTNLQPVAGSLYVPRQFGPIDAAGKDIFEAAITAALGAVKFVDVWEYYHRNIGELHCGSTVKRAALGLTWWTNVPAPP